MSRIPLGVWFGIAILLLGAWARDPFGLIVGTVLIAVTLITVKRKGPQ